MKKWLFPVLGLVIVVGGFMCFSAKMAGAKKGLGVDLPTKVERGDVNVAVVESGSIEPVQAVEVKSRVSGRLQKLYVKEGDVVVKGQLLAILDPQELKLQYEQVSAQLRGAESAAARSGISVGLTDEQLKNALIQAEQRFIQARRDWENQPTLSRASVEQARAALDNATRNRDLLKSTTHPQEMVRLQTGLDQAQAAFESDSRNFESKKRLLEKGYISVLEFEQAKAQVAAAQAGLTRAKDEFNRVAGRHKIELENAEEAIKQARAGFDQATARSNIDRNKEQTYVDAKAALSQARANMKQADIERKSRDQAQAGAAQIRALAADNLRQLNETEIRAPMNGIVTKKLVEEGELVAALSGFSGGTPMVEISDMKALQVKLQVNEIDVAKLTLGMVADISVDALPDKTFEGEIAQIAPSSLAAVQGAPQQDAVVRYEVLVKITGAVDAIKPGMSAKCRMKVVNKKGVLRLPVEFVAHEDDAGYSVMVPADAKGKPEKKKVSVGAISPTHYEITDGLKEGDSVVKPEFKGPERQGVMGGGGGGR